MTDVASPRTNDRSRRTRRVGPSRHVALLSALVLIFGVLGMTVTTQRADAGALPPDSTATPTPSGAAPTATDPVQSSTPSPIPTTDLPQSATPSPTESATTAESAPIDQPVVRAAAAAAPTLLAAGDDGFATGGSGRFKDQIQWMVWNPTSDPTYKTILGSGQVKNDEFGRSVTNGPWLNIPTASTTMTRDYGGAQLQTTCTLSNPTANRNTSGQPSASSLLKAYTPGGWAGDGLDNLYNVGGAGYWTTSAPTATRFPADYRNPNTFRIGLRNDADHAQISFDYTCSAVLVRDGVSTPVPLQGLVFADAEASSARAPGTTDQANQDEWIRATPTGTVTSPTWYLLDRYRNGCDTGVNLTMSGTTMTMGPGGGTNNGQECAYANSGTYESPLRTGDGPIANMFLKGATSARVTLQGRGYSAVALGVIIQPDFGDAPTSYGTSGSLYQPNWSNAVPNTGGNVFTMSLSSPLTTSPAGPNLGTNIDPEGQQQFSAAANGDDTNPSTLDDEDALAAAPSIPIDVLNGTTQTFTVTGVGCSTGPKSNGRVSGWIDWNGNGVFDPAEGSAEATCVNGTATLTFSVPVVPADTNLVTKAETFLRLRTYESGDAYGTRATGMTITGEVEDYRVGLPSVLKLIKTVQNAFGGTSVASDWTLSATGVTYPQDKYRFVNNGTYTLAEAANTVDATQGYTWESLSCLTGTIGTTPSTATSTSKSSPSVTVASGTATVCTFVNKDRSGSLAWNKIDAAGVKLAGSEWTLTGPGVPAGTSITDCTASPCPTGQYKDQDPVPGQFKLTALPRGDYSVTETRAPTGYQTTTGAFAFGALPNKAVLPWGWEASLKAADGVRDNGVVNKKPARPIAIQKQGRNCDVGQPTCPLPGAQFALYDTDPTVVGAAPIANGVTANPADLSTFTSANLELDKTYWLVETKAPDGFVLLGTPIRFTVTATGITLADPASETVHLATSGDNAAFTIVVSDTTAAPLPKAGSEGTWPYLGGGLALFLAAGLYLTMTSGQAAPRRVRP